MIAKKAFALSPLYYTGEHRKVDICVYTIPVKPPAACRADSRLRGRLSVSGSIRHKRQTKQIRSLYLKGSTCFEIEGAGSPVP